MNQSLVNIPIPNWYNIEISSQCNLKCPYCPTGRGEIPVSGRGYLSREDFHIILEKIRPHAQMVQLFNWGEPFMNKDVFYFIETLTSAGISSQISSNLSVRLFDEETLERLVNSGLESLLASIDGINQQSYEAYRRNGDVSKALANLRNIQLTKERLNSQTPHLIWGFHLNHFNEHEVDAAREFANEIGIDIWFKELSCPDDFQSTLIRKTPEILLPPANLHKLWRGRQNAHLPSFELDPRLPKTCNVCRMPFEIVVIGTDGSVFPCTGVVGPDFVVGNLVTDSLEDIWHRAMKENREQLTSVAVARPWSQCYKCKHFPREAATIKIKEPARA